MAADQSRHIVPGPAPRAVWLLPLAFVAHLCEEWIGGLPAWTAEVLGAEVSSTRFLSINALALPLFLLATWLSLRKPALAWLAAALAALIGLNGALHLLATLGFGRYSPGAITGLLLYLPLSLVLLRWFASRLARGVFAGAIVVGIALHGVVALIAFG